MAGRLRRARGKPAIEAQDKGRRVGAITEGTTRYGGTIRGDPNYGDATVFFLRDDPSAPPASSPRLVRAGQLRRSYSPIRKWATVAVLNCKGPSTPRKCSFERRAMGSFRPVRRPTGSASFFQMAFADCRLAHKLSDRHIIIGRGQLCFNAELQDHVVGLDAEKPRTRIPSGSLRPAPCNLSGSRIRSDREARARRTWNARKDGGRRFQMRRWRRALLSPRNILGRLHQRGDRHRLTDLCPAEQRRLLGKLEHRREAQESDASRLSRRMWKDELLGSVERAAVVGRAVSAALRDIPPADAVEACDPLPHLRPGANHNGR